MKPKYAIIFLLILFSVFSILTALQPAEPVLKKGEVTKFIKTFPILKQDLENLGLKYESRSGNVTWPQAVEARNQFIKILKKHGWDENYFQKMAAILMVYSKLEYGDQMKQAHSQIEKSLKEIEANPNLSAEMKEQLKAQIKATQGYMAQGGAAYQNIHPKDIELVKPRVKEIKKVIEKDK